MADYDSDELQFSEPECNSKAGQKSIDQIFERAAEDRISSKRVVKQLQFGRGAPSSRGHQTLWIRRVGLASAMPRDVMATYPRAEMLTWKISTV